jgi:arylsulfatase A-like enzyme
MKKPNIILLFTDDQRHDTIRALGNPQIHTPNFDALVERGTSFTHGFIPGGTCGAVCMPSRAMLHTGRTLFLIHQAGSTIPPEHTTLGEHLRANGYHTFGSGKWHNGSGSFHRSFTDGDEIFFGGMADHWNVPAYHYDPTGAYASRRLIIEDPFASNQTKPRTCDHIHAGIHSTDIIAETGCKFLESYQGSDPYFLYLSFLAPHDPRSMPQKYLELYDPEKIELPPNFLPEHPFDNGELSVRDEMLAAHPRDPLEIRRHLAEYYAMITHLDDRIGEVIEAVKKRGELDHTIFVLAGDNGLALGQHGLLGKQSLYDHSVRVPLIFAGPGIPAGKTTDAFAYLLDIFPTLCGLTGCDVPESVDGRSLVSEIQGGGLGRETLYLAYRDLHRGVRTRTHKLIEYVVEGRHTQTQLFNLAKDPWERNSLARQPSHAQTLSTLRQKMIQLRDEWEDCQSPWGKDFWKGYAHQV